MKLVPIVEGHGDADAVPVLLRRWIAAEGLSVQVARAHRLPRSQFAKESEVRRRIQLVAKETDESDAVLAICDADDDCAVDLARKLREWTASERSDRATGVVIAVTEFEAWFVAAAPSLVAAGKLAPTSSPPAAPEAVRDAKGWLSLAMGTRYSPPLHQASFAALFAFEEARSCPSFQKLERELQRLLGKAPRS